MTNYRLKSREKKDKKPFFLITIAAIAIVSVFLVQKFAPQAGYRLFEKPATMLWNTRNLIANVGGEGLFESKDQLAKDNEELRRKVHELEALLFNMPILERENKILKELWGRKTENTSRVSRVLSGPGQSAYDVLIIDLGESEGARIGQRVFAPGGFLLGFIDEVFDGTSRVKLLSNPNSNTAVVLERTGVSLSLSGRGAGNFFVQVPKQEDVSVGDIVVSPELVSSPVAVVEAIDSRETDSFKELLLVLPVNVFELSWVTVAQ